MELRYVITSKKSEKDFVGKPIDWKAIPKDHHDENIRRHYPGSFFTAPGVAFIFPEKK